MMMRINKMATLSLLVLALCLVTTSVSAQTFFLQGNAGDSELSCSAGTCTLNQDLDVNGFGEFNEFDVNILTANTSYWLPECPEGYTRNTGATGIVLCEKGLDQMVKVGNFWIDRYEISLWENVNCTGTQYGASGDDYPGTFPDNGNWTSELYACSIAGVTPSRYVTWFQAQQSCEAAGKDLCTNAEWQAAAAGTSDPGGTGTGS